MLVGGRVSFYKTFMNHELREKGYILAKDLLEPSLARVIYKTLLLQQWRGEYFRDNHMPTAVSVSNTALTDALLLEMRPRIEAISGCRLVPTYSYARVYFHGDTMIRHQDRFSCEVSVSIHLGRDGGDACLWFQPNTKVEMEEGDGAVYLGCETGHWRERFTGNTLGQLFLHYVVADGPLAAHYFDGNSQRFPPSICEGIRTCLAHPNLDSK
jgi:hypothetical protein